MMSLAEDEQAAQTAEIRLPADIDWQMLDKSRFFLLGAGLFSGVSATLYPIVVLKTRLQIASSPSSAVRTAAAILRVEGPLAFYRGFATSITGTIPARALYMTALEVTKSSVGAATLRLGMPEPAAATVANAAAGLSAAMAAQAIWTPIDVISQRLMVQGTAARYSGGVDAFRKILAADGVRGLYRGFGMSILTYAPSNAVWWASYSLSQRTIWSGIGFYLCRHEARAVTPDSKTVVAVQAVSAAVAGGVAALVTMPLDTIKTRMQVLDGEDGGAAEGRRKKGVATVAGTIRSLVREGGWAACYRGLGPRWASMSMSATTMITTYEFLKRLSAKDQPAA
ncbi:mitochondrial substrate carrier family protein [Wolffia australiana]